MEKANSRSRANWRDLATNLTCETDYFMCGLEIFLDGIFDDHDEHETLDMKSEKFTELEEEEHDIIKPQYLYFSFSYLTFLIAILSGLFCLTGLPPLFLDFLYEICDELIKSN